MFVDNWGEANIETLPQYIFVFVNEVFNNIILIFQSQYIEDFDLMCCAPKHLLEKYLRLSLQNILPGRSAHNKNGITGRQRITTIDTKRIGQQGREC